jgi:hypothetical protein
MKAEFHITSDPSAYGDCTDEQAEHASRNLERMLAAALKSHYPEVESTVCRCYMAGASAMHLDTVADDDGMEWRGADTPAGVIRDLLDLPRNVGDRLPDAGYERELTYAEIEEIISRP